MVKEEVSLIKFVLLVCPSAFSHRAIILLQRDNISSPWPAVLHYLQTQQLYFVTLSTVYDMSLLSRLLASGGTNSDSSGCVVRRFSDVGILAVARTDANLKTWNFLPIREQ